MADEISPSPGPPGSVEKISTNVLIRAVFKDPQVIADYIYDLESHNAVLAKGMLALGKENFRVAQTAMKVLIGETEQAGDLYFQPFEHVLQGLTPGHTPGRLSRPVILSVILPVTKDAASQDNVTLNITNVSLNVEPAAIDSDFDCSSLADSIVRPKSPQLNPQRPTFIPTKLAIAAAQENITLDFTNVCSETKTTATGTDIDAPPACITRPTSPLLNPESPTFISATLTVAPVAAPAYVLPHLRKRPAETIETSNIEHASAQSIIPIDDIKQEPNTSVTATSFEPTAFNKDVAVGNTEALQESTTEVVTEPADVSSPSNIEDSWYNASSPLSVHQHEPELHNAAEFEDVTSSISDAAQAMSDDNRSVTPNSDEACTSSYRNEFVAESESPDSPESPEVGYETQAAADSTELNASGIVPQGSGKDASNLLTEISTPVKITSLESVESTLPSSRVEPHAPAAASAIKMPTGPAVVSITELAPTQGRIPNRHCKFFLRGERCPYQNLKTGCFDLHDLAARQAFQKTGKFPVGTLLNGHCGLYISGRGCSYEKNGRCKYKHDPEERKRRQLEYGLSAQANTKVTADELAAEVSHKASSNFKESIETKTKVAADELTAEVSSEAKTSSNLKQLTPKTPISLGALQEISPNTTSVRVSKANTNAIQENSKPVHVLKSPQPEPENQAFFAYLNKKMMTKEKVARYRVASVTPEVAAWNEVKIESIEVDAKQEKTPGTPISPTIKQEPVTPPAFKSSSSNSPISAPSVVKEPTAQVCDFGPALPVVERSASVKSSGSSVEEIVDFDRQGNINKMLKALDKKYQGLCPALLFGHHCLLNDDLHGGCTLKQVCKNGPHVKCKIKGCNSVHIKKTCAVDVRGRECFKVQSINNELRNRHMQEAAHQIDCTDEEWFQRIIVADLVKAHYDGRYR